MVVKWLPTILSAVAVLFFSNALFVSSLYTPLSINRSKSKYNCCINNGIIRKEISTKLYGAQLLEFGEDEDENSDLTDTRTDEEKGLSHGYEGDFTAGDVVKVRNDKKFLKYGT